jgi:hypothetical protein
MNLAGLPGTLVANHGCLLLEAQTGTTYLLIWPDTYRLEGDAVVNGEDRVVARVGERHSFPGGERNLAQIEDATGGSIPGRCQTESYWLVGIE